MLKRLTPALICILAATVAQAQPAGGHGRGGGGGRGGHSGGSASSKPAGPAQPAKAPNKVEIIGVIQAIDAATGRVTISYDEVEELNWPAGTRPFPVEKTALLDGATVGEKIRFSVDSGQVSALKPF
jgi:Cu/Ag efflux protein CusF